MGNHEGHKHDPCEHFGISSTAKNVRDIVSRPLKTTYQVYPLNDFYDVVFEDASVPLSGIMCQFNKCTVIIKSISLRISAILPSTTHLIYPQSLLLSQFKVNVRASDEVVNGIFSVVVRPVTHGLLADARLSRCLQKIALSQDEQCATLLFESSLRGTSPNSCSITQIEPPIDI